MDEKENQEKPQAPVAVMDLPNVECKCGSIIWEYGFVLKRLEMKQLDGPKNVPVDIIICKRCGNVLQDGVAILKRPNTETIQPTKPGE